MVKKSTKTTHGELIVISANGAGTSGYLKAKEWGWTPIPHYIQQLIKNES